MSCTDDRFFSIKKKEKNGYDPNCDPVTLKGLNKVVLPTCFAGWRVATKLSCFSFAFGVIVDRRVTCHFFFVVLPFGRAAPLLS